MKHHQIMFTAAAALTASAFAGTSEPIMAPAPTQESVASGGWFFGGSYGQLNGVHNNAAGRLNDSFDFDGIISDITGGQILDGGGFSGDDLDFNMYTLHVGRSWGSGFYGFATSVYLEVGYLNGDTNVSYDGPLDGIDPGDLGDVGDEVLEALEDLDKIRNNPGIDIDIIPVTLNFMAERNLVGGLGIYVGAGAGYAFTDTEVFGESDTDGGFIAQASAGLVYNFTENFELFGGARWMYLDSLEFGDSELELDDAFAWEIGARVNF
jgi:hypothetical protein